jgi:hypothetical protein
LETLLRRAALPVTLLICQAAAAADYARSDDHQFNLSLSFDVVEASSGFAAWPHGGLGKLRYDESDSLEASRITIDYGGRIKPTLWARVIADYVGDGSEGLDIAEAFITWRPVPKSASRHQLRAGAMYPPFSYENTAAGWTSPYSISFSAINTWLGEEIRPVGIEWSMSRKIGGMTSPHQLNVFASAFWGNDPAATLLFWRGWSIHDRQTRLGDRLTIPPILARDADGTYLVDQTVAPFVETDSQPGFYAGIEWQFASRIRAQFGGYDNRGDPWSFSDQQWGWNTRFWSASLQAELPRQVGLIAQWMSGDTGWISGALQDNTIAGSGNLVVDHFDSAFVLLTRQFGMRHRASLRYETFAIRRPDSGFIPQPDDGDALTLSYRFTPGERFKASFEWLEINSERDLWDRLYSVPRSATERLFRVQMTLDLSL